MLSCFFSLGNEFSTAKRRVESTGDGQAGLASPFTRR